MVGGLTRLAAHLHLVRTRQADPATPNQNGVTRRADPATPNQNRVTRQAANTRKEASPPRRVVDIPVEGRDISHPLHQRRAASIHPGVRKILEPLRAVLIRQVPDQAIVAKQRPVVLAAT